jgi:methylmalonyl-CoA mutase
MKHSGELPIIGVNTFLDSSGSPTIIPEEVIRSTEEEKLFAIACRDALWKRNEAHSADALAGLSRCAIENGNLFEELMKASNYCTLGQISHALYEVGGQYRRNM